MKAVVRQDRSGFHLRHLGGRGGATVTGKSMTPKSGQIFFLGSFHSRKKLIFTDDDDDDDDDDELFLWYG